MRTEVGDRVGDTVIGDVVGTLFFVGASVTLLLVGGVVTEGSVVIMVWVLVHVGVPSYMVSTSSSERSMIFPSAVWKARP